MDLSSLMGTLLSSNSVSGISQATNVPQNEVSSILTAALPSLLQGASQQANDQTSGFAEALTAHAKNDTSSLAGFLGKVDLDDGAKIVNHLVGSSAASSVAKKTGTSAAASNNVLSAAAPLLMSLLGQQMTTSNKKKTGSNALTAALVSSMLQNVDLGSLAGSLLGGAVSTNTSSAKKPSAAKKPASSAKKKPASNKKPADDGIGLDDVASLLGKLLK